MMKICLFNLVIAILLFSWCENDCLGQNNFTGKARLGEIKQSAFYKIPLSPLVIAHCQRDLADLRLLDEHETQVPFIIRQDAARFFQRNFVEFPIIKKEKAGDKQTHITIENKTGRAINDLLMVTANMEAKRMVNISGSNDLKEWYIIREGVFLDNYFNTGDSNRVQTISLPPVQYKYFELTIIGKDILPFNIIKAGVYNENYTEGKYIEVPVPLIAQKDSADKRTYITVKFDNAYSIDKLVIEVDGPKFFKRSLILEDGYASNFFQHSSFSISAGLSAIFPENFKSKAFRLIINNDDNLPLKIKSVSAFQLNRYLLAFLEKNKAYHLAFGDTLAVAPRYDLMFFKDSIGSDPQTILPGSIEPFPQKSATQQKVNSLDQFLLWGIIALVSFLLLFFTIKIIGEMNNSNTIDSNDQQNNRPGN